MRLLATMMSRTSTVLCARQRHHANVTSDPRGIARIDATMPRIIV